MAAQKQASPPKDVNIENYSIKLNIDSSRLAYTGTEEILFTSADGNLKLDSVDLSVTAAFLDGRKADMVDLRETQSIMVRCTPGKQSLLRLEFNGAIPKLLTGLYHARSQSGDVFTTQFESNGARRAFPCLDNPAYKATFDLTLEIDRDLDAISNMPVRSLTESEGRKTVSFQRTPRMSTYLLYIGVGKFDSRTFRHGNVDIILTAPRGQLTSSDFPFEIAAGVLDLYEEYFGIPYMLPKLHLISVPEFGAGAMENWGAITFREIYLSIDESTGSSNYKSIAEVIAHEIAHQWFGDLVTMEWWNDLWLNESFATFMSYKMINTIKPQWDAIGDLINLRTEGALKNDALRHSHPIDAKVRDPEEIAQIFDEISYGKGASILRMIEGYVGQENFRNGIRKYLNDHAYGNAKGSDLWNAIEQASGLPVSRIMEAWIRKKGYPVVTAGKEGDKISLAQEQFLLEPGKTEETWPIPLTIVREGEIESRLMESKSFQINSEGFLKLNRDFSGFYRAAYDQPLFSTIAERAASLSSYDLWGIANDLMAMLQSGRMDFQTYISRMRSIWETRHPLVIQEINSQLQYLLLISPDSSRVREAINAFTGIQIPYLGEKKPNEEINVSIARAAVQFTRSLVDREYAASLASSFQDYFSQDPDMRSAIAISFARIHGDFPAMKNVLDRCNTDEDRTKIISAMGWAGRTGSLNAALELIRIGGIKRQDTARFYTAAAACPESREFMTQNFDFMIKQLREVFTGSRTPSRTIEATVPFLGLEREGEIRQILRGYTGTDIQTGIRKALELLSINLRIKKMLR